MEKRIWIKERDLKMLLEAYHTLNILERDGVDNWEYYMEGAEDYLASSGSKEYQCLEDLIKDELTDLINDEFELHRLS